MANEQRRGLRLTTADAVALAGVLVAVVVLSVVSGDWVGIVSLGATIVGFALAIRQLVLADEQITKMLNVAEATQRAVISTEAQVAQNELIRLMPELQRIDRELRTSLEEKESGELADHLAEWRDLAQEVAGLLEGRTYADPALSESLYDTAAEAARLSVELPDAAEEARVATKQIRADISSACGRTARLKSRLKLHTGRESGQAPEDPPALESPHTTVKPTPDNDGGLK
jgi:hypothetical protein